MVLWVLLLCHMWCCSCHHCTMCGVVVAVVAPHVVSWLPSLHCMWCYGCHHCATCGVAVTIIAPHVVSWSPLLCHVWFRGCHYCATWVSPSSSLHHVWCCSHCHCAICGVTITIFVP